VQDKNSLAYVLGASNGKCREELRGKIDALVREAQYDGWELQVVAEALLELAEEHLDAVTENVARQMASIKFH
jgi:hypothetical protein